MFVAVPLPTSGITLKVRDTNSINKYAVSSRGQFHLTVLIKNMHHKHKAFELNPGAPVIMDKKNAGMGTKEAPFKMVEVRVSEENSGIVSGLFNNQKGKLQDMGLAKNGDSMRVIR